MMRQIFIGPQPEQMPDQIEHKRPLIRRYTQGGLRGFRRLKLKYAPGRLSRLAVCYRHGTRRQHNCE
jgi:hypothetical protein